MSDRMPDWLCAKTLRWVAEQLYTESGVADRALRHSDDSESRDFWRGCGESLQEAARRVSEQARRAESRDLPVRTPGIMATVGAQVMEYDADAARRKDKR